MPIHSKYARALTFENACSVADADKVLSGVLSPCHCLRHHMFHFTTDVCVSGRMCSSVCECHCLRHHMYHITLLLVCVRACVCAASHVSLYYCCAYVGMCVHMCACVCICVHTAGRRKFGLLAWKGKNRKTYPRIILSGVFSHGIWRNFEKVRNFRLPAVCP